MSQYNLSDYDYELPEELIAQYPTEARGTSRLLVLERKTGTLVDTKFVNLREHIPARALLVANNSRVAPARLNGRRANGAKVELLLLTTPPLLQEYAIVANGWQRAEATVLLKPGKSIKVGDWLEFCSEDSDDRYCIRVEILYKQDFGRHSVNIYWQGDLPICLDHIGNIPLPPYIKRTQEDVDQERYQTVYSRKDKAGSVAAPTAGLHFTEELRRLIKKEFDWAEVTLHVGYGTFSPVREDDIRRHSMHREFVEVPAETVQAVLQARRDGRPVVAVGTTTARTLEGMISEGVPADASINGWSGWTDIFIYSGYEFKVVNAMLTNFHLPKSSLLMLVSALAGRETVLAAYRHAIMKKYNFFSYGDAMLIV